MALGAVLGAALNTGAAHPFTLTVAGLDVIKDPAGEYGVPLDSVRLTQAALGSVSSLSFKIEVPASSTLVDARISDTVILTYNPTSKNIFRGYVQTVRRSPIGPSGVVIEVSAQGVETILDWSVVGSTVTFPVYTSVSDCAQALVGLTIWGAPEVKAIQSDTYSQVGAGLGSLISNVRVPVTITAGTTLRAALRQVSAACAQVYTTWGSETAFTIDPNMDLRSIELKAYPDGSTQAQSDIADITALKGNYSVVPADITTEIDGGGAIQQTVIVGDGVTATSSTGRPGPVRWVADADLTTDDAVRARSDAEVVSGRPLSRGQLTLETQTGCTYLAGGQLTLYDEVVPGATPSYFVIGDVDVTFHDTTVDYRITFGAARPSLADK